MLGYDEIEFKELPDSIKKGVLDMKVGKRRELFEPPQFVPSAFLQSIRRRFVVFSTGVDSFAVYRQTDKDLMDSKIGVFDGIMKQAGVIR